MISVGLKIRAVIITRDYPTKQLAVDTRQIAQRIHSCEYYRAKEKKRAGRSCAGAENQQYGPHQIDSPTEDLRRVSGE